MQQKLLVLAGAAAIVLAPGQVLGQDKNGVSPQAISRPAGPGSLEGLGDSFQPALNTGSAHYRVRLDMPEGVAGFTPVLDLRYDSGQGFGVAGVGWTFGPGCVRRQTEKGLPRYGAAPDGRSMPDRFLGLGGEELVPLQNGHYLAKVEGGFTRYTQTASGWTARTPAGIKLEFGLTAEGRITGPGPGQVYAWYLQRQTDTNGNVIEYVYEPAGEPDRQVYLSIVRYGPGAPPWNHLYSAVLTYEDRPDPYIDYRPGFGVRTDRRLAVADIYYDDQLIRSYHLAYEKSAQWSFLSSVTQYGSDGVTALPATRFAYELFAPAGGAPIAADGQVITSAGEPQAVPGAAGVELIDVNADGLPDLLETGLGHVAYLNRGARPAPGGGSFIQWEGPVAVQAFEPRALDYDLTSGRVHLADMTGDGLADLAVQAADDSVEFFENTGAGGWGPGALMSVEVVPPPAPFGEVGEAVLTADLSFSKRMDIIQSADDAYYTWFNQGDGSYSGPIVTAAAMDGFQPVGFDDPAVHLADMNGDRLGDIVKITTHSVIYWPSRGYARFDAAVEMPLAGQVLDDGPDGNLYRARLVDISGDGLSDVVVERAAGADLWFWLNLGDGRLENVRVVTGLPVTPDAEVRWADLNGNGTTDLIYGDSTLPQSRINAVDLGRLIGGGEHFNLLWRIENGYGRVTTITYRTTSEEAVEALLAGHPWTTTVPFPAAVVGRSETRFGLDLDGYPDEGPGGDRYVSDFVYRDGYYEPIEKQFRGFAFVKQIARGDERFGGLDAPGMITRYRFHTGAPDGVDNDQDGATDEPGDLWTGREEEPLKGVVLWQETTALPDDPAHDGLMADDATVFERIETQWAIRALSTDAGGSLATLLGNGYRAADAYGRQVRHAVQTQVDRTIIERGSAPPRQVRRLTDVDALGRLISEHDLGDLARTDDDLYTAYQYAINEAAWIIDRVSSVRRTQGSAAGSFVSQSNHYYDGLAFAGLPLGTVSTRGILHRVEALVSDNLVPPLPLRSLMIGDPRQPAGKVNVFRQRVDAYGNPVAVRDANNRERLFTYDAELSALPIRETIAVGPGAADLVVSAEYDHRFGAVRALTDMSGQTTIYEYDIFGRLSAEFAPAETGDVPTKSYSYELGSPISAIHAVARDHVNGSPDVASTRFFDGLGRPLGVFEAGGGGVMSEVTLYNARGRARCVFQPHAAAGPAWAVPSPDAPATRYAYDAAGRVRETLLPPDQHGVAARQTSVYLPLATVQFDGEDNRAGGPHQNTPKTLVYDGLGRLVEVHEQESLSAADPGLFVTKYRYAGVEFIGEIEDAAGNIKYMRYDGLGRRIFMNDVDRGHVTYTYDGVGNLLQRVDALGQQIQWTYDWANRLVSEDYLDGGHPLSFQRTPDIAYHYDLPHPDYPGMAHLAGRLSWVSDLSGAEFRGYDANGHVQTLVKRIDQPDGSQVDYRSTFLADHLGRVYQVGYPDGGLVRYEHDDRGLVAGIPGFVEQFEYTAAGQKEMCALSNGAVTTYTYDPRLRLIDLHTQSGADLLQHLSYDYDQVTNLLSMTDHRPLPAGDPRRQGAAFEVDNLYRLTRASGAGYGTIQYDYDRLGNMVVRSTPDVADPELLFGTMSSGGAGGTAQRIGRNPGDPPGPHALTAVSGGPQPRAYAYDANGNMVSGGGADGTDQYLYDFADRLGQVLSGGDDIRYIYDHSGRRVIKRVNGVQTSYIDAYTEVRDGQPVNYVWSDSGRIARVDGPVGAIGAVRQSIPLAAGWNLVSFQVDPGTTVPVVVLGSISGAYTAVYGHDGGNYTRYVPGGVGNTLTALVPNRGYWIFMTVPDVLELEGPVSPGSVQIAGGTTAMVAMPGLGLGLVSDLIAQHPGIVQIWGRTAGGAWAGYNPSAPAYANTLTQLDPGRGYWITASSAVTFTAPAAGAVHFYHGDHLGSTSVISDEDGGLVSEFYNYPFGLPRHEHHAADAFDPHYGFTGKERDAESGLHYFEARYYGSAFARFTRVDPLRVEQFDLLEPQKLNIYAYAHNRPLVVVDPTGMEGIFSELLETLEKNPGKVVSTLADAIGELTGDKEAADTINRIGQTAIGAVDFGKAFKTAAERDNGTSSRDDFASLLKTGKGVVNAFLNDGQNKQFNAVAEGIGTALTSFETLANLKKGSEGKAFGVIGDLTSAFGGEPGKAVGAGFRIASLLYDAATKDDANFFDTAIGIGKEIQRTIKDLGGDPTAVAVAGAIIAGIEGLKQLLDPSDENEAQDPERSGK